MVRRLMLFVAVVVLAVPSLASAWTIAARIGAVSGSITGGSPVTTVSSGSGYLTVPAGDTTVTIKPAAGYAVSTVLLDGATLPTPATGGTVAVPQAGKTSRTLIAYFKVATYSMTVTQAPNGMINLQQISPAVGNYTQTGLSSLRTGAVVKVTATPNGGCSLLSLKLGESVVWSGNSPEPLIYNYTVGTSSVAVTATFAVTPTATARLVVGSTRAEINSPVTLDASSSSTNDPALTYQYKVLGDASKVTITPSGPTSSPTATFQASEAGSYTVYVTVTSAHNVTSSTAGTTITTETVGDWESGVCASCHTNRDSQISTDYKSSAHSQTAGIGCPDCHNPDGNLPHPHIVSPIDSCQPCHASATQEVVNDFISGPHNGKIICFNCHSDHSENAGITVCQNCHNVAFSANGNHAQFANDPTICVNCHNMHNPHSGASAFHFNGYTSYANPNYHAAYVTPRTACSNCHFTTSLDSSTFASNDGDYKTIRQQWAESGHGDATSSALKNTPSYDWKTLGTSGVNYRTATAVDCVRCHTARGFLKFAVYSGTISPIGVATDKSSEPLACNICHNPGFEYSETLTGYTNVLQIPQVTCYYNYSSPGFKNSYALTYNNVGESNVCMACHTGRMIGYNIVTAGNAGLDFTDAPFFNSHSMAAGAVLFKNAGYMWFGPTNVVTKAPLEYKEISQHILDGSDQGACVQCHMDSSVYYGSTFIDNHSFRPLTRDASGKTIIDVANSVCWQCHTSTMNPLSIDNLNSLSTGFQLCLKALAAQLAAERVKIYYNPDVAPYFFKTPTDTSPENAVRNWGNRNTLGAAFNLHMLTKEKGAYTHSPRVTKLLIYDSIDFLDDGIMNGSVNNVLTGLVNSLNVTDKEKDAALSYLLKPDGTRP